MFGLSHNVSVKDMSVQRIDHFNPGGKQKKGIFCIDTLETLYAKV